MRVFLRGYLNMNISFSTTDKQMAIQFLNHQKYNGLSDSQKEFILNNLNLVRVQDPNMYGSPSVESQHQDSQILVDLILLGNNHDIIFWNLISLKKFDLINTHLIDQGFNYKRWMISFTEEILKAKDYSFMTMMIKLNRISIHDYSSLYVTKIECLDTLKFLLDNGYTFKDFDYRMLCEKNLVGVAFLLKYKKTNKAKIKRILKYSFSGMKPKERTAIFNEIVNISTSKFV